MSRTRLSASELRSQAWTAMRNTWPTILCINFVINIILNLASRLLDVLPAGIAYILSIVVSLLTFVLQMGLVRGMLDYLRQGIFSFDHIKSMFSHAKEMICYCLWENLFLFLWMLPGTILFSVGMVIDLPGIPGLIMLIASLLLIVVPMFYALLNYTLAQCCIVDHPYMGGREALAKSKRLMRGHRWLYIKMGIPAFVMLLIIGAIAGVLANKVAPTILTLITSLLSIAPQLMALYLAPVLYEELCYTT